VAIHVLATATLTSGMTVTKAVEIAGHIECFPLPCVTTFNGITFDGAISLTDADIDGSIPTILGEMVNLQSRWCECSSDFLLRVIGRASALLTFSCVLFA
jgi:hypothetical protein